MVRTEVSYPADLATIMLTSAAYFHNTGFLGVLAILAAVLAVFLCATVTGRMSTLVFLFLCHIGTCLP